MNNNQLDLKRESLLQEVLKRKGSDITLGISIAINSPELSRIKNELSSKYFDRDTGNPHVTLVLTALSANWLEIKDELIQKVGKVLKQFSSIDIEVKPTDLTMDHERRFISINVLNPALYKIHMALTDAINPLREGSVRKKTQDDIKKGESKLDIEALQVMLENGYERSGSLFNPHITLIYPKGEFKDRVDFNELKQDVLEKISAVHMHLKASSTELKVFKDIQQGINPVLMSVILPLGGQD